MKYRSLMVLIGLITVSSLIACQNQKRTNNNDQQEQIKTEKEQNVFKSATVVLTGKNDSSLEGSATFSESGNGVVTFVLRLDNTTPGNHAVHIHENGDCSTFDGSSAGGHWNPLKKEHGKRGDGQFHAGDIGNVKVDEDGSGILEVMAPDWRIGGSDSTKNILNKALIIHAGADDFISQPSGNAGKRIGCGVIELN